MIQIYHNPRCSKSRCALDVLKSAEIQYEIVDYMKNTITKTELTTIINKLKIKPIDLVRVKESIWKEKFGNKSLTDDEIIEAMLQFPQLIERPIVIDGEKAIVGRPVEKVIEFLR
ncbi:MAG: arsenate reductase (glutaredoxin) [Capnocytophaga sp.]|nr:arsenate reductase (glutaredoxin) [Capnocytophaga sp.]